MSIDLSPLGFRKTPFTRELSVTERFVLPYQADAAEALAEAVRQRMSAVLIAPAGTGKTVALRVLVSLLPETRYQIRYVKVTGLSTAILGLVVPWPLRRHEAGPLCRINAADAVNTDKSGLFSLDCRFLKLFG